MKPVVCEEAEHKVGGKKSEKMDTVSGICNYRVVKRSGKIRDERVCVTSIHGSLTLSLPSIIQIL